MTHDDDITDERDRRPADTSEDERHVRQLVTFLEDQILTIVMTVAEDEYTRGHERTADALLPSVLLHLLSKEFESRIFADGAARDQCRAQVARLALVVETAETVTPGTTH